MIFQGILTSIAKKLYVFVIFQGVRLSPPPNPPLDPRMKCIHYSARSKASSRLNLSSGLPTKLVSLQRHASLEASLDMILSIKRETWTQISLRGCAGWSAPFLFIHPEDRVARVETYFKSVLRNSVPVSSVHIFSV